jgi:hypothetical protein
MNFKNSITTIESLQKQLLEAPFELNSFSEIPGLYALWWVDDFELLKGLNRAVIYQGKKVSSEDSENCIEKEHSSYRKEKQTWDWGLEGPEPTCLYVGKSTNLKKRLGLHFMSGVDKWYNHPIKNPKPSIDGMLLKHTTSCQMRAGIEHLFKDIKNSKTGDEYTLKEKLKNLRISCIKESCFKERFYLEDLAIGYLRPWFNLDSER